MKVLTDNKYYGQIANVIREQNGTNNTYKPPQMVSALKDLFYEEVEGVPPITFQGIGENLLDYRIDGASGGVGDRTENLFDGEIEQGSVRVNDGAEVDSDYRIRTKKISVKPITTYTISSHLYIRAICLYNDGVFVSAEVDRPMNANHQITLTMPNNANQIQIAFKNSATDTTGNSALITPDDFEWGMLNSGSTALPYEPYGYKVPVVVSGKNLFDENSELNVNGTIGTADGVFPYSLGGDPRKRTYFFKVKPNTNYTFSCETIGDRSVVCEYNQNINPSEYTTNNKLYPTNVIRSQIEGIKEFSFTTSANTKMVAIYYSLNNLPTNLQIEIGDTATTYEEYIETEANIYLDEPIGANESISLSDTNVNIQTVRGTNILTVDTTVQPSKVYVKSRKESSHEAQIRQLYESVNAELTQYKAQYGELGGE